MATVCHPASGKVTATFGHVAKYYWVDVAVCPSRHGNRKGVGEKGNHSLAQLWWRTPDDDMSVAQAQVALDEFCARVCDARRRVRGRWPDHRRCVGEHQAATTPRQLGYPVSLRVERVVAAQALVAFGGNFYSIDPGMSGAASMSVARLDAQLIEIVTAGGVVWPDIGENPTVSGITGKRR